MSKLFQKIFITSLLFVFIATFTIADILPQDIQYIINKNKIPSSEIALYIKETGSDKVVASYNIDQNMIPASVVKVFSAYAALLELGYNYRWETNFYASGQLSGGVLRGNLIVKGFGDPSLSSKDIPKIVSSLKAKGIRKITGDIILDRSYFVPEQKDSSYFDKNIYSAYNAMPDALMFNQHMSTFSISSHNGKHQVNKQIPGESYRVSNSIQSVGGSCTGNRSWPSISVDHSGEDAILRVSGQLSTSCGTKTFKYIVTRSYKEFYSALVNALRSNGISYGGKMRLGTLSRGATLIHSHNSKTLEEIISETLKQSNNLFARHLMLTVGAKIYGPPSTLQKGREAVVKILNRYHLLDTDRCYVDNGSGLSRRSQITARSMARVLDHAYAGYGRRWMNTLSIAGRDGTIKRRFQGSIVKERAWMKTGTLDDAKNIVGYVQSKNNKLYTVVILVNGKRAKWLGKVAQDEIIKWLVGCSGLGTTIQSDPFLDQLNQKEKNLWGSDIETRSNQTLNNTQGNFYVQIASFASQPPLGLILELKKMGINPYSITQNGSNKLLAGPYKSKYGASKSLYNLKKKFPQAFITQY